VTDPRIPTGPLDREPGPLYLPERERRLLLDQVLDGVDLGRWDERIVAWLVDRTDTSTLLTVTGLIGRARAATADPSASGRRTGRSSRTA